MEFDFGTLIFFAAFLWFVISEIRPKKKPLPRPQQSRRPAEQPDWTADATRERAAGARYDAELERRRLERLLQGLDADENPMVISLETPPERVERVETNYDDRAEAASLARVAAARARDEALNAADHAAFDQRIRRRVAAPERAARRRIDLRDAVVWREILSPPVTMRGEDGPGTT